MRSDKDNLSESGSIAYHIHLVRLLATCTEGKNANTEIKCHSLLSLDDILRIVVHPDCLSEVSYILLIPSMLLYCKCMEREIC